MGEFLPKRVLIYKRKTINTLFQLYIYTFIYSEVMIIPPTFIYLPTLKTSIFIWIRKSEENFVPLNKKYN